MLSRVIAKNVGDVFLRHSVQPAIEQIMQFGVASCILEQFAKLLEITLITAHNYRNPRNVMHAWSIFIV